MTESAPVSATAVASAAAVACEACKRRDLELLCTHMSGQLPPWQQRGRHDDIQRLMETAGDESTD